jgi:hypothetical protein
VQVYSQNEAESLEVITGTYSQKPTFELSEYTAKKLTGLLFLTEELSRDTDAFNTWATYAFSEELMFTLENQIVNGTGAGQCLGLMNAPALVMVAKQVGQPAGSIVGANVIGMASQLWAASRPRAIWLYNQEALESLGTLSLTTGSAQVLLWHFNGGGGGRRPVVIQDARHPQDRRPVEDESDPDTLCGIPAYPSEYTAAPGTPGDIILADFSRYIIATREIRNEVSIHVLFLTDQDAFRFIWRIDGAPIDQTSIQPLNSLASPPNFVSSPFVALAQRS